jgi:hypothetical protein
MGPVSDADLAVRFGLLLEQVGDAVLDRECTIHDLDGLPLRVLRLRLHAALMVEVNRRQARYIEYLEAQALPRLGR